MQNFGFYHPSVGYWQTVGDVTNDIRAGYPEGTIEVQLKPGADYEFDGSSWTRKEITPSEPFFMPVTRRQLRRGLLSLGIKSADVEAKIAELPEAEREIAIIDWQDASEYERSHPLVSMLGAGFGLTEAQIDAAWLEAQEL